MSIYEEFIYPILVGAMAFLKWIVAPICGAGLVIWGLVGLFGAAVAGKIVLFCIVAFVACAIFGMVGSNLIAERAGLQNARPRSGPARESRTQQDDSLLYGLGGLALGAALSTDESDGQSEDS